jgi:hypothetical protein
MQLDLPSPLLRDYVDARDERTDNIHRLPTLFVVRCQCALQVRDRAAISINGGRMQFYDRIELLEAEQFVFERFLLTVYFEQRGFHFPGGNAVGDRADDGFDLPHDDAKALFSFAAFFRGRGAEPLLLGMILQKKIRNGIRG